MSAKSYYTKGSKPTTYKHVTFRSRLEANWAAYFDLIEWKWQYEPVKLADKYTPDFRISRGVVLYSGERVASPFFIEIKPAKKLEDFVQWTRRCEYIDVDLSHNDEDIYIFGESPSIDVVNYNTQQGWDGFDSSKFFGRSAWINWEKAVKNVRDDDTEMYEKISVTDGIDCDSYSSLYNNHTTFDECIRERGYIPLEVFNNLIHHEVLCLNREGYDAWAIFDEISKNVKRYVYPSQEIDMSVVLNSIASVFKAYRKDEFKS